MKIMLTDEIRSTRKTFLDAPEWIDSIPEFCCEKRCRWKVDDWSAQDGLRVAAVRCRIQTAANFNECKINVFILLIIFSAN